MGLQGPHQLNRKQSSEVVGTLQTRNCTKAGALAEMLDAFT